MTDRSLGITLVCMLSWIETTFWIIAGAYYGSLGVGYELYLLDSVLWLFLDVFGSIIPIIIAVYAILSILKVKGEYPL